MQEELTSRIFNLIIGRVFKKVYLSFGESRRGEMERVFLSDDDRQKQDFIKKHVPNFKKLFEEEAQKVEEELELEIENSL